MTGKKAVMLVKRVTYFGEFGYLNSSCIRKVLFLKCFWVPEEINSRFCSKTQWLMFLLVSGRHPDGRQHGVSIKISTNLGKKILRISCLWNITVTWILAKVFAYLPFLSSRFWTLSFELFWFWFWFILNGVTLKTSNKVIRYDVTANFAYNPSLRA